MTYASASMSHALPRSGATGGSLSGLVGAIAGDEVTFYGGDSKALELGLSDDDWSWAIAVIWIWTHGPGEPGQILTLTLKVLGQLTDSSRRSDLMSAFEPNLI